MAGLQDNTLRIVLVGRTLSGKSATANTILGRKEFCTMVSAHAVTKTCQTGRVAWKGRNILVVDTPGLFDTKETLITKCKEISRCVVLSTPGPHAIILVVALEAFMEDELNPVKLFKTIFGEAAMKHTIILFTRKEDLQGQRLSEFLAEAQTGLKNLVEECGNRCVAFSNRLSVSEAEREAQVQELVELIEETVRGNRGSHFSNDIYTDAGEKLQRNAEALKLIYDDQLQKKIKLEKEKYHRKEVTKKEMEENIKSLKLKYKKKIREEAESNTIAYVQNVIQKMHSDIWHNFGK